MTARCSGDIAFRRSEVTALTSSNQLLAGYRVAYFGNSAQHGTSYVVLSDWALSMSDAVPVSKGKLGSSLPKNHPEVARGFCHKIGQDIPFCQVINSRANVTL